MNTELAQRMVTRMRAEAHRVNMSAWFAGTAFQTPGHPGYPQTVAEVEADCGTTGCIAGWAIMLSPTHATWRLNELPTEELGLQLLGLEETDDRLFYVPEWPKEARLVFQARYEDEDEGEIVADLLELLIKFDGDLDAAFEEFALQHRIRGDQ